MTEDASETFDLNSLNDHELIEQVHDDMYNGLKAEVEDRHEIIGTAHPATFNLLVGHANLHCRPASRRAG